MIQNSLIVGGASGIGLALACEMATREHCGKVYIVDKKNMPTGVTHPKWSFFQEDLTQSDFSLFDRFDDVNTLIITAGFGKLSLFSQVSLQHISDSFAVNAVAPIQIVRKFYDRLEGREDFYCGIMVSIAGFLSSPFFAVYGATKAALKVFIESVNIELEKHGSNNRILNVSPGSIAGTSFNNSETDLSQVAPLAREILMHLERKDDLFIPKYDEVYHTVLERYHTDFRAEGRRSYDYKLQSGRINLNKS